MARKNGRRILPFRIPIFRIFYSITYTTLYLLLLLILAITPISMLWSAIHNQSVQYAIMIGGSYVLTAILAIFIYSSRLYTNRTTLAAVGKAYIPIEDGEVGKSVRKMIVKQLERSAVVAWEGKPRDLYGEIMQAEDEGLLPAETRSVNHNDYTVGTDIKIDPQHPPWGDVQHPGWSSPSHGDENKYPNVRYADVIEELPHLIEARAVSFAPADPAMVPAPGEASAPDATVVNLLQRPANMALRDYITRLSYLGIFQPPSDVALFLSKYERVRFSGRPALGPEFNSLMATFSDLLAGMIAPASAIVEAIHDQAAGEAPVEDTVERSLALPQQSYESALTPSPLRAQSPNSSLMSPVTAREMNSRSATPYLTQAWESEDSFGSVIINRRPDEGNSSELDTARQQTALTSPSFASLPSDAGSVLRHSISYAGD